MSGQWEQQCNAEAMRRMGILVVQHIGEGFEDILRNWVYHQKAFRINFPDETEHIIEQLVMKYGKNG